MCLSGILASLEACERNSLVYVYTDAMAKDSHLLTDVIALASTKESKITFLLTNPLPSAVDHSQRYDIYEAIAASSGGGVITTNNDDIAEVSLDLINAEELARSAVDLVKVSLVSKPATSTSTYNFIVDPTIEELTIRASGERMSLVLDFDSPFPPALDITVTSDLATLKTWKVHGPPAGNYILTMNTAYAFTLEVTGSTTVTTKASLGLLEISGHGGFLNIASEPIAETTVFVIGEVQGEQCL